jgi:hypothetical protein
MVSNENSEPSSRGTSLFFTLASIGILLNISETVSEACPAKCSAPQRRDGALPITNRLLSSTVVRSTTAVSS